MVAPGELELVVERLCREPCDRRAELGELRCVVAKRARLRRAAARARELVPPGERRHARLAGAWVDVDDGVRRDVDRPLRRLEHDARHLHAGEVVGCAVVLGDGKVVGQRVRIECHRASSGRNPVPQLGERDARIRLRAPAAVQPPAVPLVDAACARVLLRGPQRRLRQPGECRVHQRPSGAAAPDARVGVQRVELAPAEPCEADHLATFLGDEAAVAGELGRVCADLLCRQEVRPGLAARREVHAAHRVGVVGGRGSHEHRHRIASVAMRRRRRAGMVGTCRRRCVR